MQSLRARAFRRAVWTSLFVPLLAATLFGAYEAGIRVPHEQTLALALLALSAIPTTVQLLTVAAGQPWNRLERNWSHLQGWQRAIASTVALFCGLTAGAAVVLLALSVLEVDAMAYEPPAVHLPSEH